MSNLNTRLDKNGHEILDDTPVEIPIGFKRPETMEERIKRLVTNQLSRQAADQGFETFEESEDFEVGEDFEPGSPFETFWDPNLGTDITPQEFIQHEPHYRKRYLQAQREYYDQVDREGIMAENLARARYRERGAQKPPAKPPQDTKTGGEGG